MPVWICGFVAAICCALCFLARLASREAFLVAAHIFAVIVHWMIVCVLPNNRTTIARPSSTPAAISRIRVRWESIYGLLCELRAGPRYWPRGEGYFNSLFEFLALHCCPSVAPHFLHGPFNFGRAYHPFEHWPNLRLVGLANFSRIFISCASVVPPPPVSGGGRGWGN